MVKWIVKSGRNYLETLLGSRLNVITEEKNCASMGKGL